MWSQFIQKSILNMFLGLCISATVWVVGCSGNSSKQNGSIFAGGQTVQPGFFTDRNYDPLSLEYISNVATDGQMKSISIGYPSHYTNPTAMLFYKRGSSSCNEAQQCIYDFPTYSVLPNPNQYDYVPVPGMEGNYSFFVIAADGVNWAISSVGQITVGSGGNGGGGGTDFDIVYVRSPNRSGVKPKIPEVKDPINVEPGTDLVLMHPDGSDEIIVPTNGRSAAIDPFPSFDGTKIYYSYFPDAQDVQSQRNDAPKQGADIWVYDVVQQTRTQLTFGEFEPNTGGGDWAVGSDGEPDPMACRTDSSQSNRNCLGYGVFNLGPCPISGGKIMFSSSRRGYLPNKSFTFPNLQLFIMDEDGSNVELVGAMNLGSALHCTQLQDGRVMFSSYEAQGLRDHRIWGQWYIYPDGSGFGPILSAFVPVTAAHFGAQKPNGDIVVNLYYNSNNYGFGSMVGFPASVPPGQLAFGSPAPSNNPVIQNGWSDQLNGNPRTAALSFSPYGYYSQTPSFTWSDNEADPDGQGGRLGKVSHPSTAPVGSGDLLVSYSAGSVNKRNAGGDIPDFGIYMVPPAAWVVDPKSDLILIRNDPNYHETQPRAVVPFRMLNDFGLTEPIEQPFLPNDGRMDSRLESGTPYGLVGTSSFYSHNVEPGSGGAYGLHYFNNKSDGNGNILGSKNMITQGGLNIPLIDAFGNLYGDEIYAVRILGMETNAHRSYGNNGGQYSSGVHMRNKTGDIGNYLGHERLRILGEIPLRKYDSRGQEILDYTGVPDTSFLAKIPADVPFTFQTIDRDGRAISISQTWHHVRPGEKRVDCGGCHAHNRQAVQFDQTEAAKASYVAWDLTKEIPLLSKDGAGNPVVVRYAKSDVDVRDVMNVEFYEDILPIVNRSCVQCHSSSGRMEANLNLDDDGAGDFSNVWRTLCDNPDPSGLGEGYGPVSSTGIYNKLNNSRFTRHTNSRRSLLIWKIFNQRLDGMRNSDFDTESVPGDPSTLPPGSNPNLADVDFDGQQCPPAPGQPDYISSIPQLTEDEKITFARWIDTGCSIDRRSGRDLSASGRHRYGIYLDAKRPTVTIQSPARGRSSVTEFVIGMDDYYSGLNLSTFSVKADFAIGSIPAGTELAGYFSQSGDQVWRWNLPASLSGLSKGQLTVEIYDREGNREKVVRHFSTP